MFTPTFVNLLLLFTSRFVFFLHFRRTNIIMCISFNLGLLLFWLNSVFILILLLFVMFILILLLFFFTIFAFVITNKVAGKVLLNRGYKEYRLGDYSNWLQNRVKNNKDWNRIRNCLVDSKVCAEFNQKIASETIAQCYQEQLSSIQVRFNSNSKFK